jgi:hypothetical protein
MIYIVELCNYLSKKLIGITLSLLFIYSILKSIGIDISPTIKLICYTLIG